MLSYRVCSYNNSFLVLVFFFFNAPATTEIYTLSLHDALPISLSACLALIDWSSVEWSAETIRLPRAGMEIDFGDRKSTRLNSSHRCISYAVFCLKKKK